MGILPQTLILLSPIVKKYRKRLVKKVLFRTENLKLIVNNLLKF